MNGPGGRRTEYKGLALAVEAVTGGLGYMGALCWGSTALVGSFRPDDLGDPYWQGAPLRTDTTGFIAFVVAAVCLVTSEYLRLRRTRAGGSGRGNAGTGGALLTLAVARPAATLGTALFAYLSLNAVTHPATLGIQATHLLPWPTEGTLRVIALLVCGAAVMARRWLLGRFSGARSPWKPSDTGSQGIRTLCRSRGTGPGRRRAL